MPISNNNDDDNGAPGTENTQDSTLSNRDTPEVSTFVNAQDVGGSTPLHLAADGGHLSTVLLLLERNADPEVRTFAEQRTALHLAAEAGHSEVVRELLNHGSDVSALDYEFQTPLHLAVAKENVDITLYLISAGADMDLADIHGNTPLSMADGNNSPGI